MWNIVIQNKFKMAENTTQTTVSALVVECNCEHNCLTASLFMIKWLNGVKYNGEKFVTLYVSVYLLCFKEFESRDDYLFDMLMNTKARQTL